MIDDRLRIGITQRHIAATAGACTKDALDSNWSRWFKLHWPKAQFLAIPNFEEPLHAIHYVNDWQVDLLILSGGDDVGISPIRDAVEYALLKNARCVNQPVIGVCRGIQLLHVADGGCLHRVTGHVGQSHTVQLVEQSSEATVNSWHRWGIAALASQWRALAHASDGSVEAMQHVSLPWLGLMWHPERPGGDFPAMWDWIDNNIELLRRQR